MKELDFFGEMWVANFKNFSTTSCFSYFLNVRITDRHVTAYTILTWICFFSGPGETGIVETLYKKTPNSIIDIYS